MDYNITDFYNIGDSSDHDCKVKKEKESLLLLKRKMSKTHDLIKQYSKNVKEINYLKLNLEIAKKEAKHTIANYMNATNNIRELEREIVKEKERSNTLQKKVNEYEINVAADKQIIQQLTCKIKDLEDERSPTVMSKEHDLQTSRFEDKIKALEHELKKSKAISMHKEKQKKIISTDFDTTKSSIGTKSSSDIGINVSLCDIELSAKCEVQDKSVMTVDFYNMKDDPYPLFCAKCEAHLPPDLTPEKICQIMSAYPKLIEKDLSPLPKTIYSPPCSLPSTYPDSTNRNGNTLSRISMPHFSPYSPYSDPIVDNPKSQSGRSSTMTSHSGTVMPYSPYSDSIVSDPKSRSGRLSSMAQISENVELRNMDISRISVAASLTNNLDSAVTLSQNRNHAREDFCSDDLLAKHSSSIKKIERKIWLLESKMKKFRRLKEKVDNNSCCHRSINCKDDILLNSNLISIICKSVAGYYDEKREMCSNNKRDIDSEKCTCSTKKAKLKRRQLIKSTTCNTCKNIFSCKIAKLKKKRQVQDTFCNKTENATKAIDILQCKHTLSVHNSFSDINASSTSLNDTDESHKREFVLHEKNTLNSAEVVSIEDSLTTSRLSADELYASDNPLDKDNVEATDVNSKTETEKIFLSNNENSTDHIDSKIVPINAGKNEIKSKSQNIHKDKIDEIYASDSLLNKDNIEATDMDNKRETGTIFLSNDKNYTDHTDDKIVDINAEKNEVKNKGQNIHEDKVDEIYASNTLLSKDNVEAIDMDNRIETGTTFLSNNENSTDHADGKIVDINTEENIIKSKGQDTHEDKVDEVYASDNLLNKNNVKAIDTDNKKETGTMFLSNDKNYTDHTDDKIVDINAEKNEVKNKGQDTHEDKVDEVYASDNLLNKNNVKAIDMDIRIETGTTFLSNNENSIDHADGKIVDTNTEENIIKSKGQDIHEDKVDEVYASDNLLKKNNVEAFDMDNRIETGTTFLSNDEHPTDHADGKIVDINAEENEIKSKGQNIYKDKIDDMYTSVNPVDKNNVKAIDMDNRIETGTTFLSNNKNSTDHADSKIVDINVEKNEIKNKGQSIYKDKTDEIYANDNFLNKDNIEAFDMGTQTKIGKTSSSKDENSTDYVNKIIVINAEESKIKRKGQSVHKGKVGERILKKLRGLKRKTQANLCINKQENIELCLDHSSKHNELLKKSRIENEEESGDRSLKSIINLKRKLDTQAESTNKQEDNKLCSDDYEPAKKLRIAHTPKTPVHQFSVNKTDLTHSTIRNIALLTRTNNGNQQLGTCTRKGNLLTQSKKSHTINRKCDEKNIKFIETNIIDRKPMNDLSLINAKDCLQNDIAQSAINIERVSGFETFLGCDDILSGDTINRSISMDRVIGEMSSDSDESDVLHNNIADDTASDLELKESIPLRTCIITQSESSRDSKYDRLTEAWETSQTRKEITPIAKSSAYGALGNKSHDVHKISKGAISNDESSVLHGRSNVLEVTRNKSYNNSDVSDGTTGVLRSPSPRDSGTIVEDYANDSNMKESLAEIKNADKQEETCVNNETIGIRAIKTRRRKVCVSQRGKGTNLNDFSHEVDEESHTPISQLNKYIKQKRIKKSKLSHKQIGYVCKIVDKFVKKQLQKLINSAWEETIHDDIVEKLSTCGPRIIAKCIVDFLLEEVDHSEALDKSFTPPAPMMTTFEQKIIALLIDLEVLKPTVIYFVQAAIEYNLFKLNSSVKAQVDSLTRLYVALSRIQKDREKIRMMCCNALYCMGRKSISVLHTVLTCWSEVLPNAENNKGILPKCIAFLIGSQQIENSFESLVMKRFEQKLNVLKSQISRFYKYTYTQETTSDIVVKELMTALKVEQIDGLDTAIILIAKKEGSPWTYKNIIQSDLLPMIIKNEHPCVYSAFSLLGRLLRAFPLQDEDNIVTDISEQLCDLIKSGQGSHDQQEGIISALLSLSRQKFDVVAPFVIKWTPRESLRPIVNAQLQAFINLRNSKFWKNYLELLRTE